MCCCSASWIWIILLPSYLVRICDFLIVSGYIIIFLVFNIFNNWNIGKRIVDHEQQGKEKAEYGSKLLKELSSDLKKRYGKGFSRSNLQYMRLMYIRFPICQTLSGKLTWSHYTELLSISDDLARSFYGKQCVLDNWSVRELKRQKQTGLFERIALSTDKSGILELSQKGKVINESNDIIKDPYVFEFLQIKETQRYSEKELEKCLLENELRLLLAREQSTDE